MNALQVKDRYQKEVIHMSTKKNDVKVQHLYDNFNNSASSYLGALTQKLKQISQNFEF